MHYTDEDYARLYNTARERSGQPSGLMLGVLIVGLVTTLGFVGAIANKRKPSITSQAEQVMRCGTWICQKYHYDEKCQQRHNTACTSAADLRGRQ